MNKKVLLTLIGIVVVIAAAVIYVAMTPNKTGAPSPTKASLDDQSTPASRPAEPLSAGTYTNYTEQSVATTYGTKLLFFHAPWCPQCRQIEDSIKQDGLPSGVTVFKIDYDSNQTLRQKYGITIQTTFVKIDDSGNKLASYVAYQEPTFSSVRRELLP